MKMEKPMLRKKPIYMILTTIQWETEKPITSTVCAGATGDLATCIANWKPIELA